MMPKTKSEMIQQKFDTIFSSKVKYVYVVGNGFDIACELKTQYKHFLKFYLSLENSVNDSEFIRKCKNIVRREQIKTWLDLEIRLGEITKNKKLFNTSKKFLEFYDDMKNDLITYISSKGIGNHRYNEVEKYFHGIKIDESAFVVLNYTNNFEKFLIDKYSAEFGAENICNRILYPHGNVFNPLYKENTEKNGEILFGVGDRAQIANKKFRKKEDILKKFVKHDRNEAIKRAFRSLDLDEHELYYSDYQICRYLLEVGGEKIITIYGCSLGSVDYWLWELILSKSDIITNPLYIRQSEFFNKKYNCEETKTNKLEYINLYYKEGDEGRRKKEEDFAEFFKRDQLTEKDKKKKEPWKDPKHNWQYDELFKYRKYNNDNEVVCIFLMAQHISKVMTDSRNSNTIVGWNKQRAMQGHLRKLIDFTYNNTAYIDVNSDLKKEFSKPIQNK